MKKVVKGSWPNGKTISESGPGGRTYLFGLSEIGRYVYEMLRGELLPDEVKEIAQQVCDWWRDNQAKDGTFKKDPDDWHWAAVDRIKYDLRKERRHRKRYPRLSEAKTNLLAELGSPTMGQPPMDPLEAVIYQEEVDRVHALVNGLPSGEQEVFILRSEGVSFKEIGAEVGMNSVSAQHNMGRARKRLASQLTTLRGTV